MVNGIFITFEGGDGVGKSVQSRLLADFLKSKGIEIVLTREPGGTPVSEEIRKILLTGAAEKMDSLTEALLYLAARSAHWTQKIKPELDANRSVICDRFQDSTLVYQGICKNVNVNFLNKIFEEFTNGQLPMRTYLIDLDPRIGIPRSIARQNGEELRFEQMDISFHENVRDGFLTISSQFPERFVVIDGTLSIEEIHELIKKDIRKFI
ncbi:MAG: dTMP kinase [Holosporales bacterium]|nr:dTMP kinase [Holosporales bacterium]